MGFFWNSIWRGVLAYRFGKELSPRATMRAHHEVRGPEPMEQQQFPCVLLALDRSDGYERECLRGIGLFARIHGPWSLVPLLAPATADQHNGLRAMSPVGVIAGSVTPATKTWLRELASVPVVDITGNLGQPGATVNGMAVHPHYSAVATLVADHFVERGFLHFAYCGRADDRRSDACRSEFSRCLAERGYAVSGAIVAQAEASHGPPDSSSSLADVERLVDWLKPLPRPLAVMACDDALGRKLLHACELHGIAVPEEVAIVGVGDDPTICELTNPPMSSVRLDGDQVGFRAAAVLSELMAGRAGSPAVEPAVLVPPVEVVTRVSSELPAVNDAVVARALHVIRENAHRGINVERLLNHTTVSRATLERRFARSLKHSPKEQILRLRLDRARQLLAGTDYSLATVATLCGFKTAAHLSVAFKSNTGVSPGKYRSTHGAGPPS
jgi:LacI family transcriptional regulator